MRSAPRRPSCGARWAVGALRLFRTPSRVAEVAMRTVGSDGLLTVARLAGWRAADACGQRGSGDHPDRRGARRRCVAPHQGESRNRYRVDIGALGRDDCARARHAGCAGSCSHAPPEPLPNGRVLSGGVRRPHRHLRRACRCWPGSRQSPPEWDVALVVTGQEETGTHGGARVAAERPRTRGRDRGRGDLRPPTRRDRRRGATSGSEGADGVGPVVSPVVGDGLIAVAAANGIEVGIETGPSTASDTDDIFTTGAGVACGIVCVPLRYMHTGGEIAQLVRRRRRGAAGRGVRPLAHARSDVPA